MRTWLGEGAVRITRGWGPRDTDKWGGCGLDGVVARSQFPWHERASERRSLAVVRQTTTDDCLFASAGILARRETDLLLTSLAALAGLGCALSLLCPRRQRLDGPTGRILRWREAYREGLWAESCRRRLWQTILGSLGASEGPRRILSRQGSWRQCAFRCLSDDEQQVVLVLPPSGPQAHGAGDRCADDVTARTQPAISLVAIRRGTTLDLGPPGLGRAFFPDKRGRDASEFRRASGTRAWIAGATPSTPTPPHQRECAWPAAHHHGLPHSPCRPALRRLSASATDCPCPCPCPCA